MIMVAPQLTRHAWPRHWKGGVAQNSHVLLPGIIWARINVRSAGIIDLALGEKDTIVLMPINV